MGQGSASDLDPKERVALDSIEFVPGWSRPSEPDSFALLDGDPG